MSRARVAVLKVASGQLSVTASAVEHGFSRRHLHRLLAAYKEGGLEALEPRSRRPVGNSRATPEVVRDRVIRLRQQLTAEGLDAGPVTIGWHLEREGLKPPAAATISRILQQGPGHPGAAQTTALLLHPVSSGATERDLAVGLHALPARRRKRCGDPLMA